MLVKYALVFVLLFSLILTLSLCCFLGLRRAVEKIADEMSQLGYCFSFVLWKAILQKKQNELSDNKEITIKMVKSRYSKPPEIPAYLYFLDQLLDSIQTQPQKQTQQSTLNSNENFNKQ